MDFFFLIFKLISLTIILFFSFFNRKITTLKLKKTQLFYFKYTNLNYFSETKIY